jgi:hypothetical protein
MPPADPRTPLSLFSRIAAALSATGADAAAVATAWLAAFGKATGAHVVPAEFAALALTVSVIYSADRLMDGRAADASLVRDRHALAWQWRSWLIPWIIAASLAALWLALFRIRMIVASAGAGVALATAGYLALARSSRRPSAGHHGPFLVTLFLSLVLLQGRSLYPEVTGAWRAALAGCFLGSLFFSLRGTGPRPPAWILPRKALAGWLFACGCAVAPYAHLEAWPDLLHGSETILFGSICFLNSLLIRLSESTEPSPEERSLTRLWPAMALIIASGGALQYGHADALAKPLFAACAAAALLLFFLWLARHRLPSRAIPPLADAAVFFPGLAAAWT